jgi:large subunit ribosomal protein L19
MNRLSHIEQGLKKQPAPVVKAGDTVRVYARVTEGEKERTQVFEGTVIARKGSSNRKTITVRKISFGVGVEKIFPLHSPLIEKIDVLREGRVRRSKLYYLRARKGRAAKIEDEKTAPATAVTKTAVPEYAEEGEPVQSEKT